MISSLFFVFAFLYSLSVYLAVSFSVVISSLFFVFAFLYSLSVYLAVSFSVVISPSVSPFVVLSKNLSTAGLLSQSQLHQSPVSQHCLFPPPTTRTRGWTLRGKVMLKILLNRLTPQAETIIAEEQAGFRPGRSTTEQIFSLRILCERYLQHQQDLFHVFVDFKKAFDRVWHAALWSTMKLYNINANLIKVIESLYSKATSAVYYNGSVGEWFRTTVGVRQGCLLSPTLFNIFLERIMTDALENHKGSVSIGGSTITNLRFADDIDALAGKEDELVKLINRLNTTATKYGMEISAEKTKLMTHNTKGISLDVRIGGQKLETVQSFKYLGSVVTDEGSKQEIMSRIAQTIGALTKLKTIWKDKNTALSSKIRLMRSLVISIFLYACETWTLTAELEKKIQTTEMRCFRRLLGISYRDHVTNEEVGNRIRQAIGPYEDLLTTAKKRKLRWYGHKTRSTGLAKMILHCTRREERQTEKEMGRQRIGMDRIKVG